MTGRASLSPPALRLRLLRDLDEALGVAYCRWPGEPPLWLNEICSEVEIRLHEAERRLERPRSKPLLPPAGRLSP